MAGRTHRGEGADGGAAAVEFALILPMLILMVIGIYEMGKIVYTRSALESAARAGTQSGFTDPSDTAAMEAAATAALTASGITGATVAPPTQICECSNSTVVNCSTGSCATGTVRHYVTVTITKPHTPMLNLTALPFGLGVDFTMTLTGESVLRAQ